MAEDFIWNLIAKKLSGEATESDLRELEKLLRENPELHYPVQTIMDLWTSDLPFDQQEAHEAFKRHIGRMADLKIDFKFQQEDDSSRFDRNHFQKDRFAAGLIGGYRYRCFIFCTQVYRFRLPK